MYSPSAQSYHSTAGAVCRLPASSRTIQLIVDQHGPLYSPGRSCRRVSADHSFWRREEWSRPGEVAVLIWRRVIGDDGDVRSGIVRGTWQWRKWSGRRSWRVWLRWTIDLPLCFVVSLFFLVVIDWFDESKTHHQHLYAPLAGWGPTIRLVALKSTPITN